MTYSPVAHSLRAVGKEQRVFIPSAQRRRRALQCRYVPQRSGRRPLHIHCRSSNGTNDDADEDMDLLAVEYVVWHLALCSICLPTEGCTSPSCCAGLHSCLPAHSCVYSIRAICSSDSMMCAGRILQTPGRLSRSTSPAKMSSSRITMSFASLSPS